jgi:tetratricopeptide (TPR) repeat protein
MARRAFKKTMRIFLNASVCIKFWLGSAMAQETIARHGGESARLVASSDGVMTSELGLAALHYQQGNYAKAELTYRRIQATMEKTLGPSHPSTIGILRLLTEVNIDLGHYSQAEEIEHRVLLILEKSLGQDHPEIAAVLSDLGRVYFYQNRYTEAESLYRRSLSMKEKLGGEDDNDTATILNNLAALYRSLGKLAEPEKEYRNIRSVRFVSASNSFPAIPGVWRYVW